jgi:hypothetical protein
MSKTYEPSNKLFSKIKTPNLYKGDRTKLEAWLL